MNRPRRPAWSPSSGSIVDPSSELRLPAEEPSSRSAVDPFYQRLLRSPARTAAPQQFPYSLFPIPYSLFPIPYSLFPGVVLPSPHPASPAEDSDRA
jgi:hypothetical protein